MSKLPEVFNYQKHNIRVVLKDGQPWWVAKDVCDALEISQTTRAVERLDDDEKGMSSIHTPGGEQEMLIVNEPGLYSLTLSSRKKEAKLFKRWIIHEVIPSIRKTGQYSTNSFQIPKTYAEALLEAGRLAALAETQAKQLEEAKPKVDFYDAVTDSKDAIKMAEVAKVLNIKGFGRNNLFAFLRDQKVLRNNNEPYQKYIDLEYFRLIESKWTTPEGETRITLTTVVYQKGLDFIRRLIRGEVTSHAYLEAAATAE